MKRMKVIVSCAALILAVLIFQAESLLHSQESMKVETPSEVVCPVTNQVMIMSEAPASYTLYFSSEAAKQAFLASPEKYLTAKCPVMGGLANKLTAPYSVYEGTAFFFCRAGCKEQFDKDPKKYAGKGAQKSEAISPADVHGTSLMNSPATCGAGTCGGCMNKLGQSLQTSSPATAPPSCAANCPAMKTSENTVTDPVCGMKITSKGGMHLSYKDTEYYFCSAHCKDAFKKTPEKYISK